MEWSKTQTAQIKLNKWRLCWQYAVTMTGLALVETAWAAWLSVRLAAWLQDQQTAHLLDLLELREYLRPFLVFLARYHPLPDHIKDLMEVIHYTYLNLLLWEELIEKRVRLSYLPTLQL